MKNILSRLLCACTLCMAGNMAFAQNKISLDGSFQNEAVTMEVLESNASSYKVKVQIHGLYDNLIENQSGSFHYLSLGRVGQLSTIGNPALPFICQIIAIPPDATMSVSLDEEKWEDIEMGQIYPAQNPVIEKDRQFTINEATYQQPFLPSVLMMGKESVWRGIRHKGVSVCPFKYFPQENRLSVLQSYTLKVDFTHNKSTALQRVESRFGLFDNAVYEREESALNTRTSNSENYDYLILLGNFPNSMDQIQFNEELRKFRIWKALKGYKTKVACIDTIGTDEEDIRDYILQEKTKGVSYVLLIGDHDYLPLGKTASLSDTGYIYGDYWYGCPVDSVKAEIPVGRFPINSVNDFQHMVDKTIKYERSSHYESNALLIAHNMGAPNSDSYQGCCEAIRTYTNYTEPIAFGRAYGASIGDGGTEATNADVINAINDQYNIINYRGHGGTNFWGYGAGTPTWNEAEECFWSSEINNMNSNTCSIFFSIACNTGNIKDATESMLEAFARSDHGAVAFLGSTWSVNTYSNSDYNKALFFKLLKDSVHHLGDLNVKAHLYNIVAYDAIPVLKNNASDVAFAFLCGGDPSLEIWTDFVHTMDCSVTSSNGNITINTGLSGNYTINLSSLNGELINSIPCNSPTCTFSIPSDQFFLAVYKRNYAPYILYYDRVTDYIEDVTFHVNAFYEASPIEVETMGPGNFVKQGNTLYFKLGSGDVLIHPDFEVEKGAKLIIE